MRHYGSVAKVVSEEDQRMEETEAQEVDSWPFL